MGNWDHKMWILSSLDDVEHFLARALEERMFKNGHPCNDAGKRGVGSVNYTR